MYRQADSSRKYGTPQRERTIKKGELKREKGELRGEKCHAVYLNDGASYCNDEFHPIETMSFVLLKQ